MGSAFSLSLVLTHVERTTLYTADEGKGAKSKCHDTSEWVKIVKSS